LVLVAGHLLVLLLQLARQLLVGIDLRLAVGHRLVLAVAQHDDERTMRRACLGPLARLVCLPGWRALVH